MPTARQIASVAPAVVAPRSPWAAHAARSRGPTLRASGVSAKRASCSSSSPTWMTPSITPIVAGTAQAARTRRSASAATAPPSPLWGSPCETSVVSSATTGPAGLERGPHLGVDADQVGHR